MKNILYVILTILICIVFPPVLIVIIPYVIYLLFTNNKGDRNHAGGKEWIKVDEVIIKDDSNKTIFNFYKTLLFDKAKNLQEALSDSEILKEYGDLPKSEYDRAIKGGMIEFIKTNTEDEKYLSGMRLESLTTFPSANIPEVILNPKEICYYYTKSAAIDTIKKVRTDISYNGFKVTQGGFRLGNMSVSANSVEGIKRFDAGLFVVTNQRLIFKGVNNHTKTMPIGSIIGIEKFEDNGVIIFLSNKETPVIVRFFADKMFFCDKKHNAVRLYNDLKWFERAISEILINRIKDSN